MENLLVPDHQAGTKLLNGSREVVLSSRKPTPENLNLANAVEWQRTQWIGPSASDEGLNSFIPFLPLHVRGAQVELCLRRRRLDASVPDEKSVGRFPIAHPYQCSCEENHDCQKCCTNCGTMSRAAFVICGCRSEHSMVRSRTTGLCRL